MAQIKTVTATTTESSVSFDCFYPYVWIRNLGENDVYAANYSGIVAGAVDVSLIKSGEVGMVQTQTDTIYVKATGTTTLECRAQGYAECPFKRAVKGGVIPSITVEPLSVSTNGEYTAPIGKAYSPVTVDVQEQPWQPLEDGYSNFWFELTDDTLSPWLNFSAKTANATIDWGDGSGEQALTTLTPTHTYSKAGKYVVKVKGVTGIDAQGYMPTTAYSSVLKYFEPNNEVRRYVDRMFLNALGLKGVSAATNLGNMGAYTFQTCTNLKKAVLSIGSIFAQVFYMCVSLEDVTIPSGTTSLGISAFYYCSSLHTITIPATVTAIGNTCFASCGSLATIHEQATTPPTLGNNVFGGLPSNFIIYVPQGTGDTYKAASGWSAYSDHILEEGQTVTRAMQRKFADTLKESDTEKDGGEEWQK